MAENRVIVESYENGAEKIVEYRDTDTGVLRRRVSFDENGNDINNITEYFDENGNLTERETFQGDWTDYDREYFDENVNLTEKVIYRSGVEISREKFEAPAGSAEEYDNVINDAAEKTEVFDLYDAVKERVQNIDMSDIARDVLQQYSILKTNDFGEVIKVPFVGEDGELSPEAEHLAKLSQDDIIRTYVSDGIDTGALSNAELASGFKDALQSKVFAMSAASDILKNSETTATQVYEAYFNNVKPLMEERDQIFQEIRNLDGDIKNIEEPLLQAIDAGMPEEDLAQAKERLAQIKEKQAELKIRVKDFSYPTELLYDAYKGLLDYEIADVEKFVKESTEKQPENVQTEPEVEPEVESAPIEQEKQAVESEPVVQVVESEPMVQDEPEECDAEPVAEPEVIKVIESEPMPQAESVAVKKQKSKLKSFIDSAFSRVKDAVSNVLDDAKKRKDSISGEWASNAAATIKSMAKTAGTSAGISAAVSVANVATAGVAGLVVGAGGIAAMSIMTWKKWSKENTKHGKTPAFTDFLKSNSGFASIMSVAGVGLSYGVGGIEGKAMGMVAGLVTKAMVSIFNDVNEDDDEPNLIKSGLKNTIKNGLAVAAGGILGNFVGGAFGNGLGALGEGLAEFTKEEAMPVPLPPAPEPTPAPAPVAEVVEPAPVVEPADSTEQVAPIEPAPEPTPAPVVEEQPASVESASADNSEAFEEGVNKIHERALTSWGYDATELSNAAAQVDAWNAANDDKVDALKLIRLAEYSGANGGNHTLFGAGWLEHNNISADEIKLLAGAVDANGSITMSPEVADVYAKVEPLMNERGQVGELPKGVSGHGLFSYGNKLR